MSQQSLNHLMVLYVHRDYTDRLNLVDAANDIIAENEQNLALSLRKLI